MPDLRVLVIAATARELAPAAAWRTLVCGVGPVDAAVRTAAAIAADRPSAILHVGIAGARRHRALPAGSLVIGAESVYCDLGVSDTFAPSRIAASPPLLAAARRVLPQALVLAIGTSGRVGGTAHADIEAMEGFAVLRAANLAGVPAIEVRAVANDIEEADRARWQFDAAFDAVTAMTPRLVGAIAEALR